MRRTARHPWSEPEVGTELRVKRRRVRVKKVETSREGHQHVMVIHTAAVSRGRAKRVVTANVVRMPAADNSIVGQFIRYHVLVRVYGGDPDAWLAQLRERVSDDPEVSGDIRFVHWIRSRLRKEPMLLAAIRRMVDATPFWRAAARR